MLFYTVLCDAIHLTISYYLLHVICCLCCVQTLRAVKTGERIVVVSNYTQTLDLIQKMCR
jgi:SNF2 family DNA or RNA helicase